MGNQSLTLIQVDVSEGSSLLWRVLLLLECLKQTHLVNRVDFLGFLLKVSLKGLSLDGLILGFLKVFQLPYKIDVLFLRSKFSLNSWVFGYLFSVFIIAISF